MGKRDEQRKLKLCVISEIRKHKGCLFGAFSSTLTKQTKAEKWKQVNSFAQAIGVIDSHKEWNYVRDVWWPNVRKGTMEKVDNAKKTGSGGGKDKILTEVDDEVLSIIGKDSPCIVGLQVPESMEYVCDAATVSEGWANDNSEEDQDQISGINLDLPEDLVPVSPPLPSPSNLQPIQTSTSSCTPTLPSTNHPKSRKRPAVANEPQETVDHLKKRLQVELLQIQIYKQKLESRKLEIELGLPRSSFTEGLPQPQEMTADQLQDHQYYFINNN